MELITTITWMSRIKCTNWTLMNSTDFHDGEKSDRHSCLLCHLIFLLRRDSWHPLPYVREWCHWQPYIRVCKSWNGHVRRTCSTNSFFSKSNSKILFQKRFLINFLSVIQKPIYNTFHFVEVQYVNMIKALQNIFITSFRHVS